MSGRELRSSIYTHEGREFFLLNPKADDVSLIDISVSLSRQCRFNGHTRIFYSVAQHSRLVGDLLYEWTDDPVMALLGLIHDAAEAYTGDISRPVKRMFEDLFPGVFTEIEHGIERAVLERFELLGYPDTWWEMVKLADDILVSTEIRDLMDVDDWREDLAAPLDYLKIEPQTMGTAREGFVRSFLNRWLEAGRRIADAC